MPASSGLALVLGSNTSVTGSPLFASTWLSIRSHVGHVAMWYDFMSVLAAGLFQRSYLFFALGGCLMFVWFLELGWKEHHLFDPCRSS